ncbi:MAG: hypothetical protein HKN35_07080 [Woeseia sp.]|nr:hypothetical protein [Woeseia sp.]NNE60638.1 hypothetical protein [Woeseia sp.]NNL53546.1 hypothetical protein [Woeseia sp.]
MRLTDIKKNKPAIAAAFALITLCVGGCASAPWDSTNAANQNAAAELESQKTELARKDEALRALRLQLEAQSALLKETEALAQTNAGRDNGGLIPPDPKPGECYARVIVYPQYATVAELKVKKEASERIEIIPARYETAPEKVLIKEASTRLEVIPAKYETVREQVLIKPEVTKLEVVPAVYETIQVEMLVEPAVTETVEIPAQYKTVTETVVVPEHTEWKLVSDLGARGRPASAGAASAGDQVGDYEILETRMEDTGDLMCLVVIPEVKKTFEKEVLVKAAYTTTRTVREPVYKTVERTVLKTPATKREITIPAEYRTVEVTRLVQPETTREITIPAEYAEVPVRKLLEPAAERRIAVPAEFTQVTRQEKVRDLHTEWRAVLCDVNMTRDNVRALQTALNEKGACQCGTSGNACQVDGVIGKCTMNAVQRYAKQKRLSSGNNYVTMEVVRDLGLEF